MQITAMASKATAIQTGMIHAAVCFGESIPPADGEGAADAVELPAVGASEGDAAAEGDAVGSVAGAVFSSRTPSSEKYFNSLYIMRIESQRQS